MGGFWTIAALIEGLALAALAAWAVHIFRLRRRTRKRHARAIRRRGYQYAWDQVMRRRNRRLTYRPEDDIDGPPGQRA